MSEAAEFIADLDEELADRGQTIKLRRPVTNGTPVEIETRAIISGFEDEELVGDILQTDQKLILSPTGQIGAFQAEHVRRNDKAVFEGRRPNIESVDPVFIGDTIVRFNCRVRG